MPADVSQLFALNDPLLDRWMRVDYGDHEELPEVSNRALSEYLVSRAIPLELRGYMGGHPADVVWSGRIDLMAISERLANALEAERISGWKPYSIHLYDRTGNSCPGYVGLGILGPQLAWEKGRSEIVSMDQWDDPSARYVQAKGAYFDESAWDGSDFFWVAGVKAITKRVRDLIIRMKIRNVKIVPLTEVTFWTERSGLERPNR